MVASSEPDIVVEVLRVTLEEQVRRTQDGSNLTLLTECGDGIGHDNALLTVDMLDMVLLEVFKLQGSKLITYVRRAWQRLSALRRWHKEEKKDVFDSVASQLASYLALALGPDGADLFESPSTKQEIEVQFLKALGAADVEQPLPEGLLKATLSAMSSEEQESLWRLLVHPSIGQALLANALGAAKELGPLRVLPRLLLASPTMITCFLRQLEINEKPPRFVAQHSFFGRFFGCVAPFEPMQLPGPDADLSQSRSHWTSVIALIGDTLDVVVRKGGKHGRAQLMRIVADFCRINLERRKMRYQRTEASSDSLCFNVLAALLCLWLPLFDRASCRVDLAAVSFFYDSHDTRWSANKSDLQVSETTAPSFVTELVLLTARLADLTLPHLCNIAEAGFRRRDDVLLQRFSAVVRSLLFEPVFFSRLLGAYDVLAGVILQHMGEHRCTVSLLPEAWIQTLASLCRVMQFSQDAYDVLLAISFFKGRHPRGRLPTNLCPRALAELSLLCLHLCGRHEPSLLRSFTARANMLVVLSTVIPCVNFLTDDVERTSALMRMHPLLQREEMRRIFVRNLCAIFVDSGFTDSHSNFYEKFQHRTNVMAMLRVMGNACAWVKEDLRDFLLSTSGQDSDMSMRVLNFLLEDMQHSLEGTLKELATVRELKHKQRGDGVDTDRDGASDGDGASDRNNNNIDGEDDNGMNRQEQIEYHSRIVRSNANGMHQYISFLHWLVHTVPGALILGNDSLLRRYACMLNFYFCELGTARARKLKLSREEYESFGFNPRKLIRQVVEIFVALHRESATHGQVFLRHVVSDELNFSVATLSSVLRLVRRKELVPVSVVEQFETALTEAQTAQTAQENLEAVLAEAPDEFRDALTDEVMQVPVTLPSGVVVDRKTVERLSMETHDGSVVDPYSKTRTTVDACLVADDLLQQIQEWVKQHTAQP